MRYLEIILKLAFVASLLLANNGFEFLAIASVLLGIVLLFNKKQSYGYELSKKEITMRRVEGIALVVFSIFLSYIIFFVL